MTGAQIIFALHLGTALLFVVLGIPLWLEKVPPNPWYGFRTPSTLKDQRIWYPANRLTGKWMVAAGLLLAMAGVTTFSMQLAVDTAAWTNLAVIVAALTGMIVHSLIVLARLKRALRKEDAVA